MGDVGAGPVLGILCGLEEEARALGPWRSDPRVMVGLSAGRLERAEAAVAGMQAADVRGLLSWGYCGGLDPALRPGDVVACEPGEVQAAEEVVTDTAKKAAAAATGARIVDLESAAVARSGLPRLTIRVVLDEAGFSLPTPALVPLREDGRPDLGRIALAVLRHPGSVPAMIGLARRRSVALRSLKGSVAKVGAFLETLGP